MKNFQFFKIFYINTINGQIVFMLLIKLIKSKQYNVNNIIKYIFLQTILIDIFSKTFQPKINTVSDYGVLVNVFYYLVMIFIITFLEKQNEIQNTFKFNIINFAYSIFIVTVLLMSILLMCEDINRLNGSDLFYYYGQVLLFINPFVVLIAIYIFVINRNKTLATISYFNKVKRFIAVTMMFSSLLFYLIFSNLFDNEYYYFFRIIIIFIGLIVPNILFFSNIMADIKIFKNLILKEKLVLFIDLILFLFSAIAILE